MQTAITKGSGYYRFENIEPGTYVVEISAATVNDTVCLPPVASLAADSRFGYYSEDIQLVFSPTIEVEADTIMTGIDGGMRTHPQQLPNALGDYRAVDVSAINNIISNNGLAAAKSSPDS